MAAKARDLSFALTVISLSLLASACRTSWNADEFIDNTLGGRPGEIRMDLRDGLPAGDKAAIAQYLTALETISQEMRGLVAKGDQLRADTRRPRNEVVRELDSLVQEVGALSEGLAALDPPRQLTEAHSPLQNAYSAYAAAVAAYAEAFANLDFGALQQASTNYGATLASLLWAHDQLQAECDQLLVSGKRLRLVRPQ